MKITHVAAGLTLMLSFVACRQDPAPTAPKWHVLNDQQIQNWQADKADQLVFRVNSGFGSTLDGVDVASVATADGKFSVTLPTPADAALFPFSELGKDCDAAPTTSNAAAKYAILSVLLYKSGQSVGVLNMASSEPVTRPENMYDLAYASSDVNVTGNLTCGPTSVKYQMSLKTGWNMIQVHFNSNTSVTLTALTQKPNDAKWWAYYPNN